MNVPYLVGSSKVSTKGQVTIPEEARDKYQIKTGDTIYFLEDNGKLVLRKGPIQVTA